MDLLHSGCCFFSGQLGHHFDLTHSWILWNSQAPGKEWLGCPKDVAAILDISASFSEACSTLEGEPWRPVFTIWNSCSATLLPSSSHNLRYRSRHVCTIVRSYLWSSKAPSQPKKGRRPACLFAAYIYIFIYILFAAYTLDIYFVFFYISFFEMYFLIIFILF